MQVVDAIDPQARQMLANPYAGSDNPFSVWAGQISERNRRDADLEDKKAFADHQHHLRMLAQDDAQAATASESSLARENKPPSTTDVQLSRIFGAHQADVNTGGVPYQDRLRGVQSASGEPFTQFPQSPDELAFPHQAMGAMTANQITRNRRINDINTSFGQVPNDAPLDFAGPNALMNSPFADAPTAHGEFEGWFDGGRGRTGEQMQQILDHLQTRENPERVATLAAQLQARQAQRTKDITELAPLGYDAANNTDEQTRLNAQSWAEQKNLIGLDAQSDQARLKQAGVIVDGLEGRTAAGRRSFTERSLEDLEGMQPGQVVQGTGYENYDLDNDGLFDAHEIMAARDQSGNASLSNFADEMLHLGEVGPDGIMGTADDVGHGEYMQELMDVRREEEANSVQYSNQRINAGTALRDAVSRNPTAMKEAIKSQVFIESMKKQAELNGNSTDEIDTLVATLQGSGAGQREAVQLMDWIIRLGNQSPPAAKLILETLGAQTEFDMGTAKSSYDVAVSNWKTSQDKIDAIQDLIGQRHFSNVPSARTRGSGGGAPSTTLPGNPNTGRPR